MTAAVLLLLSVFVSVFTQPLLLCMALVLKVGSGDPQGSLREFQGVPTLPDWKAVGACKHSDQLLRWDRTSTIWGRGS